MMSSYHCVPVPPSRGMFPKPDSATKTSLSAGPGNKGSPPGSRYQAMVFVSEAGPAATVFRNIPEPCLLLTTESGSPSKWNKVQPAQSHKGRLGVPWEAV